MDKRKIVFIVGGIAVAIIITICLIVIPPQYERDNDNNKTQIYYEIIDDIDISFIKTLNSYTASVTGKIKNIGGNRVSSAKIIYNIFDEDGKLLGNSIANINNWDNEIIWSFNAVGMINSGIPHHVELTEISRI